MHTVRIIGGNLRGRRIEVPDRIDVRPTFDRAREAVFNRLAHGRFGPDGASILVDARVADLCCGTGAMAFEAISRGALNATLVDRAQSVVDLARKNAAKLGIVEACRFVTAALPQGIPHGPFDLIFLDPPYEKHLSEPILSAISGKDALAQGGLICAETAAKEHLPLPPGVQLIDERVYGAARVSLLRIA